MGAHGRVAHAARLRFRSPADTSMFKLVERLEGGPGTDFGAPEAQPSSDRQTFGDVELRRSRSLLRACWRSFDEAVAAARGKTLSTGPRGGGRDLQKMIEHVLDADGGYLSRLARKHKRDEAELLEQQLAHSREAMLQALDAAARGELPERGPRGGKSGRHAISFVASPGTCSTMPGSSKTAARRGLHRNKPNHHTGTKDTKTLWICRVLCACVVMSFDLTFAKNAMSYIQPVPRAHRPRSVASCQAPDSRLPDASCSRSTHEILRLPSRLCPILRWARYARPPAGCASADACVIAGPARPGRRFRHSI